MWQPKPLDSERWLTKRVSLTFVQWRVSGPTVRLQVPVSSRFSRDAV